MANPITAVITGLAKPFSDAYSKRQDRKQAAESAKAKIQMAKVNGEYKAEFTDQEWEAIMAGGLDASWKDEYITLVGTAPIPLALGGGIVAGVTGKDAILSGVIRGMEALVANGIEIGFICSAIALAAAGLSIWRKK